MTTYGPGEPIPPQTPTEPEPEPEAPPLRVNEQATQTFMVTVMPPVDFGTHITLREVREFVERTAGFPEEAHVHVRRVEEHYIRGESVVGMLGVRHEQPL